MIIIGAGMAGLIAANYFRKQNPVVYEKQEALPDNHAALLRFKTHKVFDICGIRAKKVKVHKSIVWDLDFMSGCNPYLANKYSQKVIGSIADRSIWNTASEDRFIASENFIQQLASGVNIRMGIAVEPKMHHNPPIISTMPMPVLMRQLGWPNIPEFKFKPIWVFTGTIPDCDVNQTIYFPGPAFPTYRASIVGSRFIAEMAYEPDTVLAHIDEVIDFFGVEKVEDDSFRKQAYGKILPIDDQLRKEFMFWATEKFGIYSLGRFATWRQIQLDDVADDIIAIDRMMNSNYDHKKVFASQ